MITLVTGGNGFLGHHLIPKLQKLGAKVRVLVLPEEDATWLERDGVEVYRGDVRNPRSLIAPMTGVETALHLAGLM